MKMRVKIGTVVPKMGTTVHPAEVPDDYRTAMAMALHAELGSTHRAIKSAMRWTGASERAVKYWFAGERGPSGEHLVSLARHSDAVLIVLLKMADRLVLENGEDQLFETRERSIWKTCVRDFAVRSLDSFRFTLAILGVAGAI